MPVAAAASSYTGSGGDGGDGGAATSCPRQAICCFLQSSHNTILGSFPREPVAPRSVRWLALQREHPFLLPTPVRRAGRVPPGLNAGSGTGWSRLYQFNSKTGFTSGPQAVTIAIRWGGVCTEDVTRPCPNTLTTLHPLNFAQAVLHSSPQNLEKENSVETGTSPM